MTLIIPILFFITLGIIGFTFGYKIKNGELSKTSLKKYSNDMKIKTELIKFIMAIICLIIIIAVFYYLILLSNNYDLFLHMTFWSFIFLLTSILYAEYYLIKYYMKEINNNVNS